MARCYLKQERKEKAKVQKHPIKMASANERLSVGRNPAARRRDESMASS